MGLFLFDRIAFSIGSISIYWYGLIIGTGALLGVYSAMREGSRFGISPDFFLDLLMIGAPTAIVVARIYYVAFEWSDYHGNWMQIVNIRNGGIAIHGALIGAIIAAVWYTRRKGYSFWRIADICAPSLLIGQIIGRWGNFTNQEAHGGPVDVSFLKDTLHLPDFIVNQMNISGVYYHPTFLYESVWNLAVLVLLLVIRRKFAVRSGELFLSYLGLYSIGRFFIEGLRTDSLAFHGPTWIAQLFHGLWTPMTVLFGDPGALPDGVNVRAAQAISMGILVLALVLAWLRRQTGASIERYRDPILRRMK